MDTTSMTKTFNNIKYISTFPNEWIEQENSECGPKNCCNCAIHGTFNGIFVGYCANCAQFVYNYERGNGFVSQGRELLGPVRTSAWNTYMNYVELENIKNTNLEDDVDQLMKIHYPDAEARVFSKNYLMSLDYENAPNPLIVSNMNEAFPLEDSDDYYYNPRSIDVELMEAEEDEDSEGYHFRARHARI